MANLDLATLVVIFPLKIVELLGHYTLDEVVVGLELFCFWSCKNHVKYVEIKETLILVAIGLLQMDLFLNTGQQKVMS